MPSVRLLLLACLTASAFAQGPAIGAEAPAIDGRDWINTPSRAGLRLDDLRGQAVVVSFFASWCGRCRRVLPTIEELRAEHAESEKLAVVAVHGAAGGDRATVEAFVAGQGMGSFVCVDSGATASRWGVVDLPAAFVLSHEGAVLWKGNPADREFATAVADAVAAVPALDAWQAPARATLERVVSLTLPEQPLRSMIEQLGEATAIPMQLGQAVDGSQRIAFRCEREPLGAALEALLATRGLKLEFGKRALRVVPEE